MQAEIINYPVLQVALRRDLYSLLDKNVKKLLEETGASYFAHNLVNNYRLPGHKVSSFYIHEEWQDVYWKKFWHSDPVERDVHKNAQQTGLSVTSWQIADPESECMDSRTAILGARDGATVAFQHSDGSLENFTLAWGKFDVTKVDLVLIEKIQNIINPIRRIHRQVLYRTIKYLPDKDNRGNKFRRRL